MKNLIIAAVLSAALLSGCCSNGPTEYEKVEFVRLFMHRPGDYSVLVKQGDELVSRDINNRSSKKAKIICDVEPGKPMWFQRNGDVIFVHVHSEQDVGGDAFKPGKAAQVQTTVVK